MGSEAKRRAALARELGALTGGDLTGLRIRRRTNNRIRRAEESRAQLFISMPKGSTPLTKDMLEAVFGGARAAKAAGASKPVVVGGEVPDKMEETP